MAAGMNNGTISVERVYFGDNPKLHEKKRTAVNGVLVERDGRSIRLLGRTWPITTARMVAAALLELAEAAEVEPDPELLSALMDTVEEHLRADNDPEDMARDILAVFNVEKRRES
ncbi:hypothetical protein [Nonomuraea sp. NPDC005650]|uniref:hypothetical protein n=1 Tax=Nonomuraea sp. NPDC005650 TaxID=3157045 RepID=UPI0033A6BCC9